MNDPLSDFASQGEYRSSERSNTSLAFSLLFVGIAIGAIAALLYAPKTGKKMRRALRRKFEDARGAMEDLGDQAGDWIDKGSDLVDKGSDWAEKAKSRIKPIANSFGG